MTVHVVSGSGVTSGEGIGQIRWVEARNVWKRYGSTTALRGLSARFEAGSITVVSGANGAGKSTLLNILAAVARPTRGGVWYEPIGDDVDAVRERVGWVGHESLCYPGLSVRENVELAGRVQGVDAGEAWRAGAERFGLAGLEKRRCGGLSRGQLQRVALARALGHGPEVLLLDEPWTGLDGVASRRLDEVVREERERGAVVVVVAHDAGVGSRLGAIGVKVERGRVV